MRHSLSAGIHQAAFISSTDPETTLGGATLLQEGVLWLDTTTNPPKLKARNSANTGWNLIALEMHIEHAACSDEATALAAGTAKVTWRASRAFTLLNVRASLTTPQTSNGGGGIFTVDINKNGTTVLSTKITIDNTEKTSVTAATAAVISVASFADDDEISVDIDQIGDGTAKGLKVKLIGVPA